MLCVNTPVQCGGDLIYILRSQTLNTQFKDQAKGLQVPPVFNLYKALANSILPHYKELCPLHL